MLDCPQFCDICSIKWPEFSQTFYFLEKVRRGHNLPQPSSALPPKLGFLWLCGSYNMKHTPRRCLQAETSWPLPTQWENREVGASYFHFINKKQLERKPEPRPSFPLLSPETGKAIPFLPWVDRLENAKLTLQMLIRTHLDPGRSCLAWHLTRAFYHVY